MNDARTFRLPLGALTAALFAATAVWYAALVFSLCGIIEFAGLRFFWTGILGLGPFVCLALVGLLADGQLQLKGSNARLHWAAMATGLSPWLWLALALCFGLR